MNTMMWSHGDLVIVGLEGGVSLCIAMKNMQWILMSTGTQKAEGLGSSIAILSHGTL